MDDSQKYYPKWKKPDTDDCILYSSIYMMFKKRQNYSDRKQIADFQGLKVEKGTDLKGVYMMERFCIMTVVVMTPLDIFFKPVHLKLVNSIIY